MRKGLLAQWHRGIALRGAAGALLLMVPVTVAATIGLGGVGGGLTSFANGPSESSVNPAINTRGRSQSIESLSATLAPAITTTRQFSSRGPDGGGAAAIPLNENGGSGGTLNIPASTVPPAAGAGAAGGGVGGSSDPVPLPPPTSIPVSNPEVVKQLLQGLLGQSP